MVDYRSWVVNVEVQPQARIDLLVDGAYGERRRLTEYSGVVWYGGLPQMTGMGP